MGGAPSRHQACDQADSNNDNHNDSEGQRVRGGDASNLTGKQTGQCKAGKQSSDDSCDH